MHNAASSTGALRITLKECDNGQPIWLRVSMLFDAPNASFIPDTHLVYDKTGFLHVSKETPPPDLVKGVQMINARELAVLPLLFDAHTHISMCGGELHADKRSAALLRQPATILAEAQRRAQCALAIGVGGMRDGGDKDGVGLALSKTSRIPVEKSHMPLVMSPGAGIHRKGRYGGFFCSPIEDHASLDDVVANRFSNGADHLKIVPTGIINFKKGEVSAAPQLNAREISLFVSLAHREGKMVMAHASGSEGIGNSVEGGVDTVEHGYFVKPEQLEMMADKKIAWVPTFAPVYRQVVHADIMGWDDLVRGQLQRILDDHAKSLQYALRAGVRVLIGSDAGSYGVSHAFGLVEEMRLIEESGMSTTDVLATVCYHNISHLAPSLPPRLIKPGHPATFLVTSSSVAASVKHFRDPLVIVGGQPRSVPESTDLL